MTPRVRHRARAGSMLARPSVIFAVTWSAVTVSFLFSVLRSEIPLEFKTILLIGGSISAFFYIDHIAGFSRRRAGAAPPSQDPEVTRQLREEFIRRLKRRFFGVWAVGIALTVVAQKGFPLLWIVIGDGRGYAEFGIPTLNGGLQALYISVTVLSLRDYLLTGKRRFALHTLLLFSYCLLIMSRGLMLLLALNLAGCYLLARRLKLRQVLQLGLFALVGLYLMNFVGESRNPESKDAIRQFIADTSGTVFEDSLLGDIKRGWFWVEMYGVAPLSNLNFNINTIQPLYYPNYTLRALFPTVVREHVFQMQELEYEDRYGLVMVNTAFNTFTFYANYLRDFGLWGCAGILLIVQLLASRFYYLAVGGDIGAMVGYAGIFAALVLSPFTDYFGTLLIIAQISIAAYIQSELRQAVNGGPARREGRRAPQALPSAAPSGNASAGI